MTYKYHDFSSNRTLGDAKKIFEQRIKDATYIYKKHKTNFKSRSCPICNGKSSKSIDSFYDMYNIDQCCTCASIFVNPVPDITALSDYYTNCLCNRQLSSVIKARYDSNDFINDDRLAYLFDIIKNITSKKVIKILEIGCNNGTFLSKLRQFCDQRFPSVDFELSGVDIDKEAIENSVDDNLNLLYGLAENISKEHKNQYDIIVHFELIEHLINPKKFVQSINDMLVKNGKMMFTTPNIRGLDNQALNYNNTRYLAHAIFPPMHINAFSVINISHFLIANNFSIDSILTPGKFDIDILSKCSKDLHDDVYKKVALLDKNNKALVQELLVTLGASSHMQCVASKK
jgi:2-polyprenyl-6-hydroxyphenyl methylase / 3-demethylubiquinone-9 3-methyltransferase